MNIDFFGHNCFFLEGKKVVVVSDPWLSEKGAFFGSWFQWPINHHCKDQLILKLDVNVASYLYLSHEHQDHFDKETLEFIQPYLDGCFIPKYEDRFLYNEMVGLGYKVTELADQTKHYFNDSDYIELMIVDTGVNHDSAAIIHIDDETFVNQNDCKIFDRLSYLESLHVDYYAVQFSGATWHPVCYDLDEDEKQRISKKKVMSKLVAVRNAIQLINPKYYLPSAGPAIFPFLDEALSFGIGNIFVHQPDITKYLRNSNTEVICLRPGDRLDPTKATQPVGPPSVLELDMLRKDLVCEFHNLESVEFNTDNLLSEVHKRLDQIKDIKFAECPKLIFDWRDEGLEIDFNNKRAKIIDFSVYRLPEKFMRVAASRAYFNLMGNPSYRWQDIYLSLRASVERVPDIFNTFVNIFLFSDPSNIRSGFTTTLSINDDRIVVVSPVDGKNYEINRYCPHNGADLKDAKIDDKGNLICPRHSWLFSLSNQGECQNADASIAAREVLETISLCETISARLIKNDA